MTNTIKDIVFNFENSYNTTVMRLFSSAEKFLYEVTSQNKLLETN